jgi:dATP pyrophosphohydrolase
VSGLRRPESILLIVYTGDLEVLLLKRIVPFEFWQSITGSLDPGETPREAAARELLEETGIAAAEALIDTGEARTFTIDPRWLDRYPEGVTRNLEHEWRLRLPTADPVVIDPGEHSAWRWCPIEEAIDAVWSWTNKEALEALRDELSRN